MRLRNGFGCYGYTQIKHAHIHVTIVAEALPGKGKYILWSVTSWIGALTGAMFTYAAYEQTLKQISDNSYTMMLHLSYSPVYLFSVFGLGMFTLALIVDAVKAVIAIFSDEYAREVSKTCFINQ